MRLAGLLFALALAAPPHATGFAAGATPDCRPTPLVLWGDGRHDDAAALNAWFRGANVRWAGSGAPVGPAIEGHDFVLSAPLYVPSGSGRTLERFRIVWPRTGERLAGGMIAAGRNPDAPPRVSGITKIGGDPGEGVPHDLPQGLPPVRSPAADCLIS